ncbi:hypothetical protein GQR36_09285 [Enterococcus termitis]
MGGNRHYLSKSIPRTVFSSDSKEELDSEGNYSEDIIGCIQGHDELGIYIADQKLVMMKSDMYS